MSPNPASTHTTVSLSSQQVFSLRVVSVLGELLQTQTGTGSITIDCSTLKTGIYFIEIKQGNTITTKRLIVE
jgi:hypothetical protein